MIATFKGGPYDSVAFDVPDDATELSILVGAGAPPDDLTPDDMVLLGWQEVMMPIEHTPSGAVIVWRESDA